MASYSCSICGARLKGAPNRCHVCGSEIDWDKAIGRVSYTGRIRRGQRRRRRWRARLIPAILLFTLLALLVFVGQWGLRQSMEQRQTTIDETIVQRLRFGIKDLMEGDITSARGEFSRMTMLEPPSIPDPTPFESPLPEREETAELDNAALRAAAIEKALMAAQMELDANNWSAAMAQLRALSQEDTGVQAGLVDQMLFTALYNQALTLEAAADIAGAEQLVEEALHLRPGNVNATRLKQSIDLYVSGKAHMEGDWAAAINAFTDLFAHDPDFQDTPEQLFLAYAGYGDSVRYSDPCLAVERYQLALQLHQHPQVQAKLADARLRCEDTLIVENSNDLPVPQTGGPTPFPQGRIAYTYFEDTRTHHTTRFWDIAAGMPSVEIAQESLQPDVGPEGHVIVRSTNAENYGITLHEGPGLAPVRLTDQAGDSLPRWSPEGKRILFSSISRTTDRKSHLFILDLSTGLVVDLGEGQGGDWSPEGRRIVYQGCHSEACGLWIYDLENRQRWQLTTTAGDSVPCWSPDGRYIAFMSNGRSPSWDIFVIHAETGTIPFFALESTVDGLPAWSPDGETIAFLSNRENDWAIYVWSLEDLSVSRLFPVEGLLPAWQEAGLAWEPR
ncbi:MAG: hypothetical protein GY759_19950 [Chloroflexi bacterium]|nr:hypothetical protein [Chloroflexota bacterium]